MCNAVTIGKDAKSWQGYLLVILVITHTILSHKEVWKVSHDQPHVPKFTIVNSIESQKEET